MRLRVHIEFLGLDQVKITKFSRNKTINVKDLTGRLFDFDSFGFVSHHGNAQTDFCLGIWNGDGSLAEPYELAIHKRDYDDGKLKVVGLMCAKGLREITVEETLMPESLKK
ncbi:MAG: hypothetical protein ACXAC5_03820 [Promethearchaeota archaeon]|jgi:hypothetical protein